MGRQGLSVAEDQAKRARAVEQGRAVEEYDTTGGREKLSERPLITNEG